MSPALSFAPALIVAALCVGLIIKSRRSRAFTWWASLLTLIFLAIKLMVIWIAEPFQIVPVVGMTIRGLLMPLLIPEVFVLRFCFRDAIRHNQVNWPLLVTALAPFGSAILGAAGAKLVALLKKDK